MSSTISTGRKVGAIDTPKGVFYVLFEATYESNCYPHTPRFWCVGAGFAADAIRRVFALASDTCGGMLRGPSGNFTPQGYVRAWFRELAKPRRLVMPSLTIDSANTQAQKILEDKGHGKLAREFDAVDVVRINSEFFTQNPDVLAEFFAQRVVHPSRVFTYYPMLSGTVDAALGLQRKKSKAVPQFSLPGKYQQNKSPEIICEDEKGELYVGPWEYALRARFVHDYAETEILYPGCYTAAFWALDNHFKAMPMMPEFDLHRGLKTLSEKARL